VKSDAPSSRAPDASREPRRPYRMRARASSTALTGERILDAAVAVFWERPVKNIPLDEVARRAGVSVQTVIRHFGDKDGLFTAAMEREYGRIRRQRDQAAVADLKGAVRVLVDHYEEVGDGVLRMLAEEHSVPGLREVANVGRGYHREWCERVFAAALAGRRGAERDRRLAQLIAVTDVMTWKLLRRDRGLSRKQTELAVRELLEPLSGGT
jgi:AcrR family transcriptional regulator